MQRNDPIEPDPHCFRLSQWYRASATPQITLIARTGAHVARLRNLRLIAADTRPGMPPNGMTKFRDEVERVLYLILRLDPRGTLRRRGTLRLKMSRWLEAF